MTKATRFITGYVLQTNSQLSSIFNHIHSRHICILLRLCCLWFQCLLMPCLVGWRWSRTVRRPMHRFHFHVQAALVLWMPSAAHLPLQLITQVKHFSRSFLGNGIHVFLHLEMCACRFELLKFV